MTRPGIYFPLSGSFSPGHLQSKPVLFWRSLRMPRVTHHIVLLFISNAEMKNPSF